MGWPQITWIVLASFSFAVQAVMHGKPRAAFSLWHGVINTAISTGLLYAGGFFG